MTLAPEEIENLRGWLAVAKDATYYEILGVLELADETEIRTAYHRFALCFHPDNHPTAPPGTRRVVTHLFQLGVEAYRVLSDPVLRADYDAALARGALRLPRDAREPQADDDLGRIGRSPAAQLLARRASRLIDDGKLQEARKVLTEAWERDDYDNPQLEQRIEALDVAIFVGG